VGAVNRITEKPRRPARPREWLHRLRRDHPHPRRRRGGQPALSADAEALAAALRDALPDAEPFELDPDDLAAAVAAAGADPGDDALVARALVAWEGLLA
jgi:hypothetical protein